MEHLLVRAVGADLSELDESVIDATFVRPEDSVLNAAAWSRAAGLDPDQAMLREIFEFDDAPEIFLGLKLVDRMLDTLGLPAKQSPDIYEEA